MQITVDEYNSFRAALIQLGTSGVARVTIPGGKTIEYRTDQIPWLETQISKYEMANGIGSIRTYARQIRRR